MDICKIIKKYWYVFLLIICFPLLLNIIYFNPCFSIGFNKELSSGEWLSFFGSYFGGLLGGVITLLGVILTIRYYKKQYELEKRDREKQDYHNLIIKSELNTLIKMKNIANNILKIYHEFYCEWNKFSNSIILRIKIFNEYSDSNKINSDIEFKKFDEKYREILEKDSDVEELKNKLDILLDKSNEISVEIKKLSNILIDYNENLLYKLDIDRILKQYVEDFEIKNTYKIPMFNEVLLIVSYYNNKKEYAKKVETDKVLEIYKSNKEYFKNKVLDNIKSNIKSCDENIKKILNQ